MGLNRLSFARVDRRPDGSRADAVAVPMVDGAPLFVQIPSSYIGLPMSVVARTRHFLGGGVDSDEGLTVILDGSCGVPGCCGVFAAIDISEGRVVWRDFFSRGSDISPTVRFVFDRSAYETALSALPDVPLPDESRWPLGDAGRPG